MIACAWCKVPFEPTRADERFHEKKCRQAAWRIRKRFGPVAEVLSDAPARFAYADPPYPGKAFYYEGEPTYGGEVDHPALVARLEGSGYAGWALSTNQAGLEIVLPILGAAAVPYRVCAWVKPIGVSGKTYGLHNAWEPIIVVRGRPTRPGVRDWIAAQPARFGGDLMGRKPLAFCGFLFRALGMQPGDELDDLFPGTGIVTRAWLEVASSGDRASLGAAPTRERCGHRYPVNRGNPPGRPCALPKGHRGTHRMSVSRDPADAGPLFRRSTA